MPAKFLIILCAGKDSYHAKCGWFEFAYRNYDVFLCCYEEGAYDMCKNTSDVCELKKGPKWQLIRHIVNTHRDKMQDYDAIWLPDDDLHILPSFLNDMFEIFAESMLDIAQPSLAPLNVLHNQLKHQPNGPDILNTGFVEIMAPILRKNVFWDFYHVIDRDDCKCGWGLDECWSGMYRVGVLNRVQMTHQKPFSFGAEDSFYKRMHIDPWHEKSLNVQYIYDNYDAFAMKKQKAEDDM